MTIRVQDIPRTTVFLLFLIVGLIGAGPALAEDSGEIVGPGGSLVQVRSGSYGELFPGGVEASSDSMVLALDTFGAEGQRLLIPGTASIEPEEITALHYAQGSDQVYILWASVTNIIHPALYLASFDGARFTDPITIIGNPFAMKSLSQLAINRDIDIPFRSQFDLGLRIDRTLLGVAWVEDTASGRKDKRFQGLLLQNGIYTGLKISFDLTRLLSEDNGLREERPHLDDLLRLQVGDRNNTSIIGFYDPVSRRIVSLEIELLPMPLSLLANQVSDYVLMEGTDSVTTEELASAVEAALQEMGEEFHPGSLQYMIEMIRRMILESGAELDRETLETIYDKFGPTLIMVGYKMRAGGLDGPDPITIEPLTIGNQLMSNHHVAVVLKASWATPEAAVGPGATLHLSKSGRAALIAWDFEDGIRYLETEDEEWSSVKAIALRDGLDRDAIRSLLARRITSR